MAEDVFEIVGTVVGGAFNVEAVIAEGGFAVVYRAYHAAFHASVALKCLKVPAVRRVDQREFLERFREEGEVMFRLSQSIPSVVRPLHVDAFETSRGVFVPYMALEWLDGESLDVVVTRRRTEGLPPMSPKRVVQLLSPVARALQRAHNFPGKDGPVSIVHRDLKPDNIVIATVNNEEVVKILDFGIAKVKSVATQVAGRQSQGGDAGAVPFTPGYAAPEQWFPKRYGQSGPWTDVWGLALCAVESMSGRPAIDGDHAAMMGTAVDEKRRPSPVNEGVLVDDEVEQVFLHALAVDPRDRYHDIGSFWDALENSLGLPSSRVLAGLSAPLGDSRSDDKPALVGERAEAALQRPHRSVRPSGASPMSSSQLRSWTPEEFVIDSRGSSGVPHGASTPNLHVPDLEFAGGPPQRSPFPKPPKPDSQKPSPTPKRQSDRLTKKAGEQRPEEEGLNPAPAVPLDHGFTGPRLDVKGSLGPEPSGIDLAISPADVRRTSSAQMRAVHVSKPIIPPDSRFSADVVPQSSVRRQGSRHAVSASVKPPAVEIQHQPKRLGLPIGLATLGILVAIAYYINASMGGGRWALGPVPVNWIAGVLTVVGTGMLLVRLFWPED